MLLKFFKFGVFCSSISISSQSLYSLFYELSYSVVVFRVYMLFFTYGVCIFFVKYCVEPVQSSFLSFNL